MYEDTSGFIACQECKLGGSKEHHKYTVECVALPSYEAARQHLLEHRAAGHAVPNYAIEKCEARAADGMTP